LTKEGLVLEEMAPGIDIEKNIKAKMDFAPIVSSSIREMDERLFKVGKVGMREEIINVMRK
jgi:acyl CoA:acetate/3-ketoacid CoA transferase